MKLQSIKKEKEDSPQKQLNTKLDLLSDEDSEEEKPNLSLMEDDEDIDENEKRANEFLKEFDSGIETVQHGDEDSSDESSAGNFSKFYVSIFLLIFFKQYVILIIWCLSF